MERRDCVLCIKRMIKRDCSVAGRFSTSRMRRMGLWAQLKEHIVS